MSLRKILLRLLVLWLLASVIIASYAWLYVQRGLPPWVDVSFVTIMALVLTRWTGQLPIELANRRIARGLSWAVLALAASSGIVWTYSAFVGRDALNQNWLYILAGWLGDTTFRAVSQFSVALRSGIQRSLSSLARAVLICLADGILVLLVVVALRIAWISIQPALESRLAVLQPLMLRLPLRRGRWLAWLRRALMALLVLSFFVSGLAIVDNASAPEVRWRWMANGPDVPLAVYSLVQDSKSKVLYAGTTSGVYRSTDAGMSWQAASAELSDLRDRLLRPPVVLRTPAQVRAEAVVRALAVDGRTGSLYAGTAGGVFGSSDGGASWQAVNAGLRSMDVRALAVDEKTGSLYAGTAGGVFRSSDGGASWQAVNAGLRSMDVRALAVDGRMGSLYAGTLGGVFRSSDGGASWQAASAGLSNTNVFVLVVDGRTGSLYAGTIGGVFRSSDGGTSWQAANTELSNTDVRALAVDGRTGSLYAGTAGGGVFRSRDRVESWQKVNFRLTNTQVYTLLLDESGRLYVGTAGGVFHSLDGGTTWQAANTGLVNLDVRTLAFDPQRGVLYAGITGSGVFRLEDGGTSWQAISAGLTDTDIRALAFDQRRGNLYAGTYDSGVFRSTDNGMSWQPASKGLDGTLNSLVMDQQRGVLYAGTRYSIYRSVDGGASWQAASAQLGYTVIQELLLNGKTGSLYAGIHNGRVFRSPDSGRTWEATSGSLTAISVLAMALDESNGALYVGEDGGGLFRLPDGGQSWQPISAGLPNFIVPALALDQRTGVLYAGTWGDGIFRSADGGTTWQAASTGLKNSHVRVLVVDSRNGTIYAGTAGGGVFRSADGGATWQAANAGLTGAEVWALAWDKRANVLYAAGTTGGVFRSANRGATWQEASAGLGYAEAGWGGGDQLQVGVLVRNQQTGMLYAGTRGGGVFRTSDGGASWQQVNTGLPALSCGTLTIDEQHRMLYVACGGKVFRSTNGGESWQQADTPSNVKVLSLTADERNAVLYATTGEGVFRSRDGGTTWEDARDTYAVSLRDLLSTRSSHIITARTLGAFMWVYGDIAFRMKPSGELTALPVVTWSPSGDKARMLAAWGATIAEAELTPGYQVPLAWLTLRALAWSASLWVAANLRLLAMVLGLAVVLRLAVDYANLARPFGIPLWATFLARRRLDVYARPEALEAVWPSWEQDVRAEVLHYGDAIADDLRRVPGLFRHYALRRYAQIHGAAQMLELQSGCLRLLTSDRLRRWHGAWAAATRDLGQQAGFAPSARAAVDQLSAPLAEALGLVLGRARSFEAACAWQVEAPALRLNIPARFPLIFVADPQPSEHTVQTLVNVVDVMKETGYFAVVVPLESPVRKLDVAVELRRVLEGSPHVHDFIVLSQADVFDMLMAQHPTQILVKRILDQVDLSVVSPFVISGPVPETMFFGREAEVKTLVEKAGTADFAIIGNRKIGKTSLLKRTQARLAASGRVQVLLVDCQTVRNTADFFAAFQAQTGIELPSATPEGFAAALKDLQKDVPLVLIMDEVDALLAEEQAKGESLAATWRALAQAGVCHFVFCGSTGLARCLDDPHSVFFNFPQPMPLGYLPPETARLVLIQPLETLGIILEEREELVSKVLALTSGHPNFIQYVGRGLVEAANRRKERRILLADLDELRTSTDFCDYYLKTVLGEAGPLEKLITYLASSDGFGVKELETALGAHGIQVSDEELDAALKLLRIYAILDRRDRMYSFVPRAFPEILHRTQEVERLIALEKRRLAAGGV